jgi:hypothetical protein
MKPISERWREAAEKWVELEAAADILESTKSSVLSQMMMEHGDIPVSKAETLVKRSQKWIDHVKKVCDARRKANEAKVEVDFWRMVHSEHMSREATERLEAKL